MSDNQQKNLIVNYLPQTLSDEDFRQLFATVGPVKSSKIVRHKATGYSYGFGFVEYVDASDADAAIDSLNGYQIHNKKLKVAFARPRGDHIKHANLYIRGVPKSISQQDLEEKFSECGTIIQCTVLRDESTNVNKGVAFVLYDLKEQADAAIEKFNGETLPGGSEPLSVKFAEDNSKKVLPIFQYQMTQMAGIRRAGGPMRPGLVQNKVRFNPMANAGRISSAPSGYVLFVYNIGADTDERGLEELFGKYGEVVKADVIRDLGTNQSKGYGFVTMKACKDAVSAIEALNGTTFGGKPLQVSFKTPKL